MRHLNDQYFSGNQLKEVADPSVATDAATKGYVDAALANAGGGGHASLDVTDDDNGHVAVSLQSSSYELIVTDDNNGNITIAIE